MPICENCSVVDVPFESVWTFYSRIEELKVLTPEWIGLRITKTNPPDGDGYQVGTQIRLQFKPFDRFKFPGEWVVEITDREVTRDRAYFIDQQVDDAGPFETYRHRHEFVNLGDRTLIYDRITYSRPFGVSLPIGQPVFRLMLWHRHRKTKHLLES